MKTPIKLSKDLIIEAILGIRFSTKMPAEVVYGHVYQAIADVFPDLDAVVTNLPVLQLPEDIRKNDLNLRYQPYWMITVGLYSVWVGDGVINFSVRKPYTGWGEWRGFMMKLLPKFYNLLKGIEQISLRYINFTDETLCDVADIDVKIGPHTLSCNPMAIQTESTEEDITRTFRLANNATVQTPTDPPMKGSVIDVEVGTKIQFTEDFFQNQFCTLLEKLHELEKQLFFETLQKEFLDSLKPEYGDK